MTNRNRAMEAIKRIDELPTLPGVIAHVLQLIKDPKTSATDIGKVLSNDIALSSKILKIVNSAFYGLSKKIASVNQGVVILGFNAIKSAVLGVSVIKAFNEANYQYQFLGKEAFWVHAIGTASTCKAIAKRAKFQLIEEAFVTGIIHDIGKLIFDQFFKVDYIEVFNQLNGNDKFLYEIEREVIGVDHTKIGWSLIELWNFPENLANAVAFHHLPDDYPDGDSTTQTLIDIVHLGNILSKSLDFGYSGDKFISKLDPESWKRLNFSASDIKPIIKDSINEFFCANEFLSVVREV